VGIIIMFGGVKVVDLCIWIGKKHKYNRAPEDYFLLVTPLAPPTIRHHISYRAGCLDAWMPHRTPAHRHTCDGFIGSRGSRDYS
jgi:hypothetical protein